MAHSALPEVAKDTTGTYVKNLGWKGTASAGYKHVRFYLGRDRAEAQVRAGKLEQAWASVELRWQKARTEPRPVWDQVTTQIAQAIARGERSLKLDIPARLFWNDLDGKPDEFSRGASFESNSTPPEMLVSWLRNLQADFPMIALALSDEEAQTKGEERINRDAQDLISRAQRMLKKNTSQRLHAALDAFGEAMRTEYSDASGKLSLTGQVCAKDISIIKDHCEDITLGAFDLDAIEANIRHWSKRPMTKRGKPAAVKTCKNIIKRFRSFLRWLHRAKEWDWRRPEDYEVRPVKIKLSDEEQAHRANGDQVQTYTDAELVTLWKHCKPRDRVLMLLALNCGFGIAELATLQLSEIQLNVKHRKYGTQGSYIMRIRRKNNVYSEWALWSITVDAIRWYLSQRPETSAKCLFVTAQGEPLADQTAGGNRAQQIPSSWYAVIQRVRNLEDEKFRALSYNKLRKTAINAVREVASGEDAGVFAAHGQPVPSDTLLDFYSNRDFSRVHTACTKWGERLSGLFRDAVASPFEMPKRKHKKPEGFKANQARVVALRQEKHSLRKIAELTGISFRMVRHYIDVAKRTGLLVEQPQEQETQQES